MSNNTNTNVQKIQMYVDYQKEYLRENFWPILTRDEAMRYMRAINEIEAQANNQLREQALVARRHLLSEVLVDGKLV